MAGVQSASPTLAVVIVVDSSITLASEWPRIRQDYFPHLFRRLAGENHSSLTHLRLGFITYGTQDCDGSPVFFNRFFALSAINELKDDPSKFAMGRTVTRGSLGMAALEGYAAAIEMFDILKSGANQKPPLRPLNLNESRERHKEEFSCHLWHFAAGQPDDAKHPLWNSLPTLDTLTWPTVPVELKKRDINCSILLVCPSPKFSELFSAIADTRLPPWFPTHLHHTVLLSGFAPSPKPKAAVPPTIPAKRPAETPAEQRSPGPKIAKPPSQTASPALTAAKRPIPQSSPLVPPATAVAPPPSLLSSPSLYSSPPKPPPREPPEPGIIDLTQPTPELAPAAVQNRAQPSKPVLPNLAQAPQPIQPPTQSQAPTTPQSQLQLSMQPQPQPPSQSPSVGVGVRQMAGADVGEMRAKLQQVELRIRETQKRQVEAANAGNTEEANKQRSILSRQVAAYKKGCEFVEKVEYAKKVVTAAQAQGSSQPPDSALNPATSQHPTPAVSTPQATPPMNPHLTPRLATPRKPGIPLSQNPISGMNASPNINPNSGVSAGPGPPANTNTNTTLLQAFNPTAAQTPPQVGLGGVSTPDAHMRGATPQHGHAHTNSFGTQPPQLPPAAVATQMKQFAEQRGPTQGNQGLIVGGNSSGTNSGAGPQTAGGVSERMNKQWSGTLTWQGTDTARNERKEVRAQVTATATKGDPMVSTWPKVLSLAPAGPAASMDEIHDWMRKHNPVVMQIQPTPGTDEHGYGQLLKLLRDKGWYAVANWEIPGSGQLTTNLLIAPFAQGLLGAAFPTTGIPEIPKPRLLLDPAIRQTIINALPPHIRNMPEPQLSQAIMQIYVRRFKPTQGGVPLHNAVTLARQQQQQQQQQHQQQQQQQQQRQQPLPPQQHQQQQSADHFLQNPGVNMQSTGSMFPNMGPKQGELNPFVPGSQANAIASGLLAQPTPSQQLQQRQHQQQAHTQQQHQAQQQNQQRAMMEMQRALSGGLGAGVAGGLGGGLMNTGGTSSALGLSTGGLNPLGMGGNMGPAGITAANNGLPVGGFRNGGGGGGLGMGVALPASGAGFVGSGTGLDGAGAPVGAGEGAGVGMAGMLHGAAGGVTLGMYQSFMQRNGEGGQGQ